MLHRMEQPEIEQAKKRATAAFEALRFSESCDRGRGTIPRRVDSSREAFFHQRPGPKTRSIRLEHDQQKRQKEDRLWKVMSPRWPVNADGKWYWKTDTSSDELDGHFFFYALYYDLNSVNRRRESSACANR